MLLPVTAEGASNQFIKGIFLRRLNRFLAEVEVLGEGVRLAHVPTSGRLAELLIPGTEARLETHFGESVRKTKYTLVLIRTGEIWVDLRAARANRLFEEALKLGLVPGLAGFPFWKREVGYHDSRLDFALREEATGRICLVEVKSVTLVREGTGFFPDAPTERGGRHLEELIRAVGEGYRGAVVFVAQRPDVKKVCPNDVTDPAFGRGLRKAAAHGVEMYAVGCRVGEAEGAWPAYQLPVEPGR